MKTTNKVHYVYKITNLNPTDERLYYIGVHSDKNPDPLNDGYMGSSKYLDEAMNLYGKENFKKEILSIWSTREEASFEEIRLHNEFDVAKNKLYYNKSKAKSTSFDTTGNNTKTNLVLVIDVRDNSTKQVTKELFNSDENYISFVKGKVNVIDTRDNITKQVTKEDYRKFDYYKFHNCQKVTVLDKRDGETKQIEKSDYEKYDFYISCKQNMMSVIDIRNNETLLVSSQDYDMYDFYVSTSSKKYSIFNSNNEIVFKIYGSFKKFCNKHTLPKDAFRKSYKTGGTPIFQSPYSRTKPEYIRYKGWYALEV